MIRMSNWKLCVSLLSILVLAVGGVGCQGNNDDSPTDEFEDNTTTTDPSGTANDPNGPLPVVDQQNILFPQSGNSPLETIYFDFDSSSLRPDALAALRDNAELMQEYSGVYIQIAGHCDERGTQEYNLALGERRALAVRSHLIQLGVDGERLLTITYGEELPAVSGNSEAAYSQNRRCEFNMASAQ